MQGILLVCLCEFWSGLTVMPQALFLVKARFLKKKKGKKGKSTLLKETLSFCQSITKDDEIRTQYNVQCIFFG